MNWKLVAAGIGLAAIANTAAAQVYRCKDAAGATVYAQVPCSGANAGEQIQRSKTREEILEERLRVAEENARKANMRAQNAEGNANNRAPQERTVNINIRNDTPDKSKSYECATAKKELQFVSSIQTLSRDDKRARMSAADTNVRMSCQ